MLKYIFMNILQGVGSNRFLDYAERTVDKQYDEIVKNYSDLSYNEKFNNETIARKKLNELINIHFLEELSCYGIKIFISGSATLKAVLRTETIEPKDVDMYLIGNYNPNDVIKINKILHIIFEDEIDTIIRYQYTLNWKLKNGFTYQLVLPPTNHIADIFATYHGELVCIGYDVIEEKFKYAPQKFGHFYETGISYFTDILLPKLWKNRVALSVEKYKQRGFNCIFEHTHTRNLNKYDTINSLSPSTIDVKMINGKVYGNDREIGTYSNNIFDVYNGDMLKPFLLAFSICNQCQDCGCFMFNNELSCYKCSNANKELTMNELKISLHDTKNILSKLRILITGGRCGLGNKITEILSTYCKNITITTRSPECVINNFKNVKIEQMDLRNYDSVKNICNKIENDEFDIIILNAFETLHYTESVNKNQPIEFNNDRKRNESGVWLKTLDSMNNDEIIDPILTNIIGNIMLIQSYIKCLKQYNGNIASKLLMFVTSFEGKFQEKSPFHPVTNATKSAIEQLIFTLKRQMDMFERSYMVMVDPSWVYTKTTNNIKQGPITMEGGAFNILRPFIRFITGNTLENAKIYKKYNISNCIGNLEAIEDLSKIDNLDKKYDTETSNHLKEDLDEPTKDA